MKASAPSPSHLPHGSCPDPSFPSRYPGTSAAAGSPFFLELRFLSALCLAPGVAVCDTVVALPLHWHPQQSADQIGRWGQGSRYMRSWEAVSQHIPAGDLEPRGCGALSSAGLCAPEEGLSRGVGRRARVGGSSPVRQSWKSTTDPSLFSVVSSYTNAFAITQFFGVLCAPWNGLLMDRLKQKYQKEARRTGETWAPEHQGARRGEAFTYFHLHLFSF